MIRIRTSSEKDTISAGFKLGKLLRGGDIVCLNGQLGTGKTAFAKGIAKAVGVKEHITSPTFTIVNEYAGDTPLFHFDVYRVPEPEELYEIGFDEYLDGRGIVLIEWAELVEGMLPSEYIIVTIEKCRDANLDARIITIIGKGEKYSNILDSSY
jgi:tRNA threonylcarbamoyladenosine biosynthesis protein TsaE